MERTEFRPHSHDGYFLAEWHILCLGYKRPHAQSPKSQETTMKARFAVLAPALVLAVSCTKDRQVAADTSLSHDLTLAGQAKPGTLDSISAAERSKAAAAATAAANRTSSTPAHKSTAGSSGARPAGSS